MQMCAAGLLSAHSRSYPSRADSNDIGAAASRGSAMPTKQSVKRPKPLERKSRFSTAVNAEALEFIQAIELYKTRKGRPFPSWTEVLLIARSLGYRKVAEPTALPSGPDDTGGE